MKINILLLSFLFTLSQISFGQDAIINEMSQGSAGSKEWVEILVVTDNLDMRDWELGDYDDGIWHSIATFTSDVAWSSVEMGTLIVIYNDGDQDGTISGPDTDFSDKVVLIPISDITYLTDSGPWPGSAAFANTDGDDCAAIRDAFDAIVHDMAMSHPVTTISSPSSSSVKYFTEDSVAEIVNDVNWTESTSTSGTPGAGNGGNNTTWVTSVLPVELVSFKATVTDDGVLLNWTTATEVNNYGFEIQQTSNLRSLPNLEGFETIGFVEGHGNSNSPKEYSFIDATVAERSLQMGANGRSYRLKQIDTDGSFEYSDIVTVNRSLSKTELFQNHPNPFNPTTQISFSLANESDVNVSIYNALGQKVYNLLNSKMSAGTHTIDFNASSTNGGLSSGFYIYRLVTDSYGETPNYSKTMKMLLLK